MSSRSFYVVSAIDTHFCVCMLLNFLNKCACIINLIDISILFFNINLFKNRELFVRMYKNTGYCMSASENLCPGTICPRVQIDGVLFVRMCKSTGYYLSACAKMTGYYLSGVLFVRDSAWVKVSMCLVFIFFLTNVDLVRVLL